MKKLSILLDRSEGLFARLHRVSTILSNSKSRPAILDDKAFSKVSDAFNKAFPKMAVDPNKIAGYDLLVSQHQALYEQLGMMYFSFVDACEWIGAARDVIGELRSVTCLKYDVNPRLTEAFLDLVQVYMRLLFLIQSIGDRQVVLCIFCRCYFHLKYVSEPSFDRTAEFIAGYSEVVPRVQADFRNVSSILVDSIMSL